MGDWYSIGLAAGLGSAIGVLLAGILGSRRALLVVSALAAAGLGIVVGLVVDSWAHSIAGAGGGALGAIATARILAGAARRGGTRGGLALLVAAGAVVLAGLAFVPVVGYLEAILLPALSARLRARAGERYAGLRTLAK